MQLLAVPQNAKRVRSQTATHRLDDGQHRCCCDGCIHRIAALPQHAQTSLCRQGVRGGHDVAGEDGKTRTAVGIVEIECHGVKEKNEKAVVKARGNANRQISGRITL